MEKFWNLIRTSRKRKLHERIEEEKEARQIEIEESLQEKDDQIKSLSRKIEAFEQIKLRFDEDEEKLNKLYEAEIIDNSENLIEESKDLSFK